MDELLYGGKIKNYPREVVEKMLEWQVNHNNPRDVSIFEKNKFATIASGGFDWNETTEGCVFWVDVLMNENFDRFFDHFNIERPNSDKNTLKNEINLIETEETIKILKEYNNWRRGDFDELTINPKTIGDAIDTAIKILEEYNN